MFACIYVPNFPVAAALRAEPELKMHALVILEGKPPLEKIIAVNEKAARMGIAPGMTKAQAELCAELALRARSPLQESAAHAALLDCAQSFSPCVEDAASDTVLLDLAGMESLFGSLPEISRAIDTRAATLGLEANVAVACNPDAAVLAARGFPGVSVIPSGQEATRLSSLPTEVLFADRLEGDQKKTADRLLQTLNRWGIRNLHGLAALPEVSLSERIGQEGLRLQHLARGAASRTLVPVEAPPIFEEAIELEHPIVLLEPLAFLLNRLLEQLCARLGSRALSTQELRLTLELENFSPFHQSSKNNHQFIRTLSLPLPMLDTKVFLKLLQLDLNAHPPGAPIVKIHLSAEPARPRSAQGGLFCLRRRNRKNWNSLSPASPAWSANKKLERWSCSTPIIPKASACNILWPKRHKKSAEENSRLSRSNRRHGPAPVPSATARQRDIGKWPARAYACPKKKEVQGEVLWKAGPWRSSGDWWEREAWSRDEWDIALRNRSHLILSPRARLARRRMVCGRNV